MRGSCECERAQKGNFAQHVPPLPPSSAHQKYRWLGISILHKVPGPGQLLSFLLLRTFFYFFFVVFLCTTIRDTHHHTNETRNRSPPPSTPQEKQENHGQTNPPRNSPLPHLLPLPLLYSRHSPLHPLLPPHLPPKFPLGSPRPHLGRALSPLPGPPHRHPSRCNRRQRTHHHDSKTGNVRI